MLYMKTRCTTAKCTIHIIEKKRCFMPKNDKIYEK